MVTGPLVRSRCRRERCGARESPARYTTGGSCERSGSHPTVTRAAYDPGLDAALTQVRAAVDELAAVNLEEESDASGRAAAVELQRLADRLTASQLRVVSRLERREAHRADGAVTATSWLRARTRLDHHAAARLVTAARRLEQLPTLQAALARGAVTYAHVTAVTDAAAPRRMPAVRHAEETLVELGFHSQPRDVRRAMRFLADLTDPDGAAVEPLDERGPDERRHVSLQRGIDGLWELRGLLDRMAGEALATALEALDRPDPADTPISRQRSTGQRRADALGALARRALDGGELPTVGGQKQHMLMGVDLHTLLGEEDAATFATAMRHGGEVPAWLARRYAADAKVTAVLSLGPWRVVNVGRTQRTLPGWLRMVFELVHRHCRGPDCDRKLDWTDAHHLVAWADGGETDLNSSVPVCRAHHQLVTSGAWSVDFDPDTGVCTWTGPAGQVVRTHPPRAP